MRQQHKQHKQHDNNGSSRQHDHNCIGKHDDDQGSFDDKGFRTDHSGWFFGSASACSGCGGRIHG